MTRVWVCTQDGLLGRVFGGDDDGYALAKEWVVAGLKGRMQEFREFSAPAIYRITYWREARLTVREAIRMDVELRP